MKTKTVLIVGAGGLAAYAAWRVYQKGVTGSAADIAAAAVGAVGDLFAGGVLGIGDALGLPRTNSQAGAQAFASGDYFQASKLMPAGEFLGAVWDRLTASDEPVADKNMIQAQENARLYGGTVEGWLGYGYIDNDPVQLRGSGLPTASKWGTQTGAGWPWER